MPHHIDLSGTWQCEHLGKTREVHIPGLHLDATLVDQAPVIYRRQITLPDQDWTHAALHLNGARFRPLVMIDGAVAAWSEGGMGRLRLPLSARSLQPGATIDLAIHLCGLGKVPLEDASRIPNCDQWRSNVAACLWDTVQLQLHGPVGIARVVPFHQAAKGVLELQVELDRRDAVPPDLIVEATLTGPDNTVLSCIRAQPGHKFSMDCSQAPWWSPEFPACCQLSVQLLSGKTCLAKHSQTWGRRDFFVQEKQFILNGQRRCLRAASIVWHRWVRTPEGQALGWDQTWVTDNVLKRLKNHGADTIRFHLGMPPKFWLEACDRLGLLVQAEWSFFHGLDGGHDSIARQWHSWLADCLCHPSVVIHHAWNETDGPVLAKAFGALETATQNLPPMILSHRDVCHVHKYWWSLFENVGIMHDHFSEFPQAAMVDEFGGNYLDGEVKPGGYPMVLPSQARFLGTSPTREQRLTLQAESNARVAEYWRRIGVAGFSTFCTLGSWEDGNHHYLGTLAEGQPKPVWDAMTAAWAPVSVSLDLWDRNFLPGQTLLCPLDGFNETSTPWTGQVALRIRCGWNPDGSLPSGKIVAEKLLNLTLPPGGKKLAPVNFLLPTLSGTWTVEVEVLEAPGVQRRVVSWWRIRTISPKASHHTPCWIPENAVELHDFALRHELPVIRDHAQADLLVFGRESWPRLLAQDSELQHILSAALDRGATCCLLDLGPWWLGQAYPEPGTGPAGMNRRVLPEPQRREIKLPRGIRVEFQELPEPESHLHSTPLGTALWHGLDQEATWLWNGLRGGLVTPASNMNVLGLDRQATRQMWLERGAPEQVLRQMTAVAYELSGHYAFALAHDPRIEQELRKRIRFLVEDAPALAGSLNPEGPITRIDLGVQLANATDGGPIACESLARCGLNLTQSPLVCLPMATGGNLILSTLITSGRLGPHLHPDLVERNPHYNLRPDPAAQQFVLNVLKIATTVRTYRANLPGVDRADSKNDLGLCFPSLAFFEHSLFSAAQSHRMRNRNAVQICG